MKTKKTQFIIVFLLLSIFIKTDYRLETGIYCCKDDHDYYAHAETLVLDFDFDYSNQLFGNEEERFFYNGKSAPSTFFGTSLLAAPFLFVGNIFDKLIPGSEMFNYKIIFYSFSSIFYLLFTFLIFNRINEFFCRKFYQIVSYYLLNSFSSILDLLFNYPRILNFYEEFFNFQYFLIIISRLLLFL